MRLYIKQKVFSWGDSYELNISDPRDEIVALDGIVLCCGCIFEKLKMDR